LRTPRKPRNANKGWTRGHEGSTNILQVGAILTPLNCMMRSQSPTTDDAQHAVVLGRWGPSPAFSSKKHIFKKIKTSGVCLKTDGYHQIPSPAHINAWDRLLPWTRPWRSRQTRPMAVAMRSYRSARHWGMPTCPWDGWFCCRWFLFDKKSGTGWCSEFVTGWWTRGINSWTVRIVNPSAGKCLVVYELNLSASFQFAFSDFGWFKKFLGGRPQNEQPIPCLNTTDDQYSYNMYPENCKRTLQMGTMFEPIFWRGRSIILRGWFSIAKVF